MSNLFTGAPGATSNNPRNSSRSPFYFYLFVVLAGMLVFARPIPAFASGNVEVIYPPPAITTPLGWGTACFKMAGQGLCGVRTAGEACYYWNSQYGWTFNWTGQVIALSCDMWNCPMTRDGKTYNFTLKLVTPAGCPVPSSGPSYVWNPDTGKCTRSMCPDHASSPPGGCGPPTSCTCDDNYVPDPTGTSCVPAVAACPSNMSGTPCACNTGYKFDAAGTSCVPKAVCTAVTELDDITDPVAKLYEDGTYSSKNPDIEHLTQETQAGLACIKQKVIATNCNRTPQATSGYRPAAYQKHIYDVYTKWQKIKDNSTPECAEVKAAIKKQFDAHSQFAREPGKTSNHSQTDAQGNPAGAAVDISFVPDNALISADAIACQCNMYRPLINMPDPTKNDPVHYQPRTCPR